MKNNFSKILFIALIISTYVIGVGQGCSKSGDFNSGNSGQSVGKIVATDGTVANTITLSTVYGKQILDHLVSCMGTGVPSTKALEMYNQKEGTISVTGDADSLSAPMLIGETSIAGEVCEDLIQQDKINARVFIGIDLNSTTLPSDQLINDSIRRIALSCWQKTEDDVEREIIKDGLNQSFATSNEANTAHDAMLFLCTSMLSSTNALIL